MFVAFGFDTTPKASYAHSSVGILIRRRGNFLISRVALYDGNLLMAKIVPEINKPKSEP